MNSVKDTTRGSLKISGNAVHKIAESAAVEVKGAALDEAGKLAAPKGMLPVFRSFYSPVKVRLSADSIVIDITVVVMAGFKAHSVAAAIQESVKSEVQSMTGLAVSKVNVIIAGIQSEKTE